MAGRGPRPEVGRIVDAPDFERYGEEFDPVTGMGGVEIWIPVKTAKADG